MLQSIIQREEVIVMLAKAMLSALQEIQTYTKLSFFWLCSRQGTQPHFSESFLISFLTNKCSICFLAPLETNLVFNFYIGFKCSCISVEMTECGIELCSF